MLKYVDQIGFDTIILARGGGSIEDLWNFNEELLARTIYECHTPIITGIGHETDFTICDFVSDYRGVTPTAAAMKATPDQNELKKNNMNLTNQLVYKIKNRLDLQRQYLNRLQNSYCLTNPEHLYSQEILRLIHLQDQLTHQFQMFDISVNQTIKTYQEKMKQRMDNILINHMHQLQQNITMLDTLSPLKVMQRGYTLIKADDKLIKSACDLTEGEVIDIQFHDGHIKAQVK